MPVRGPDFKPGQVLPGTKYQIVRELGAGGMGVVYQVVKPPQIQGVLKLMAPELAAHDEFRKRFLDEVHVLAQLDHPNIVKVSDYDTLADGTPFYVMEVLTGRTVRDVVSTVGKLPARVAFEITRQLCEALHCAHTHTPSVVHRDIKPENIFLHAPKHGEPVLKLIDFGVVAIADRAHDGTFVGTWKYAAPEQIRGERATPATDLYAVGLVLYEMLSGVGPFDHVDSGELVSQAHLYQAPQPVSYFAPWVPSSIVSLIASALAKDPKQRPKDAYAFAERLFELEWASDGKDPNDRTAEGPLKRALTSVAAAKPKGGEVVAAGLPATAEVPGSSVPKIEVPPSSRHKGPTIVGVGGVGSGEIHDRTAPDEDALLEGLGRGEAKPAGKRRSAEGIEGLDASPRPGQVVIRPSGADMVELAASPAPAPARVVAPGAAGGKDNEAVTLDAPPSSPEVAVAGPAPAHAAAPAPADDAPAARPETDTFASQQSEPGRVPTRAPSRFVAPLVFAGLAIAGLATFVVIRGRGRHDVAEAPTTSAATGSAAALSSAVSDNGPVATNPINSTSSTSSTPTNANATSVPASAAASASVAAPPKPSRVPWRGPTPKNNAPNAPSVGAAPPPPAAATPGKPPPSPPSHGLTREF